MRVLMRAVLLMFPGFSDHLPCDYEKALREELSLAPEGRQKMAD